MTATVFTVMVAVATVLSQVCAARPSKLSGGSAYCTGTFCRKEYGSSRENRPSIHIQQLLKSRISSIYSDSLNRGGADLDVNGRMLEDKSLDSPVEWRDLSRKTKDKPNALHLGRDGGSTRFYPKAQNLSPPDLKHPQVKRLYLPQGPVSPRSADFIWHAMYKPEEIGRVVEKRQQGWHIQYGKRDSIEVDKEGTVSGQDQIPDLLLSAKRMRQSQAGGHLSGNALDQITFEALDYIFLSKDLTYSQRERLIRKLTSVLQKIDQQGHSKTGHKTYGMESVGRDWGERSTPPIQSASLKTAGSVSAYNRKIHPGATKEIVKGGSNPSSEMVKRQQGWHVNYGKRDGESQTYF